MFGPAFDGSGVLVNRLVPKCDASAFVAAGYKVGQVPPDYIPPPYTPPLVVSEPEPLVVEESQDVSDAIPEDFPGYSALGQEGITTFTALEAIEVLTDIPGIGKVTADKITDALHARGNTK